MKAEAECIPCIFKQIVNIVCRLTSNKEEQIRILHEVIKITGEISFDQPPADISNEIISHNLFPDGDPYKEDKRRQNRVVLDLYPRLKSYLDKADDRLHTAFKLAAAGNIIDLGISSVFNIEDTVERTLSREFVVDHYEQFRERVCSAKKILYIGDNAGEIVFDKLLIEEMDFPSVTFAVKSGHILNDATEEDAKEVGLDKVAKIISTGQQRIGINLPTTSPEFRRIFEEADLIISKGQGNYETLEGTTNKKIFFILKAKCDCVARSLGVKNGEVVLINNG